MKLWYNVPILISLFQHILSYDGIRLVEEVGSTLCPYTDYCHTNSSREMNETLIYDIPIMRSCLPCSCDNDCWELHTCCPDKEEIIPEPAQLPCTQSKVKERPDDDDDPSSILDILNQRAGANYKIVDSCPSSENNETLKRKCEGLDPKTLSDYIWVSDGTTGRIYQNVHCIKCHGIKQIWYWNFQTSCQGVLDTAMNIEDVMLSVDCDITNAVPEDRKALVAKYQCFDFEHERTFESDCNVSSVSGDLIKNFMTACHKSTWPYMTGSTPVKMYKNVFCYVCQFGFDAVRDVFMMMETAVSFGGRSFSALINYVDSQNSNMNYQPHTCYSSQVYDPYVVSIN